MNRASNELNYIGCNIFKRPGLNGSPPWRAVRGARYRQPPAFQETCDAASDARLPRWVIRVILNVRRLLPVYPDKRTSSEAVGTLQTRSTTTPNIGRPASFLEERPF